MYPQEEPEEQSERNETVAEDWVSQVDVLGKTWESTSQNEATARKRRYRREVARFPEELGSILGRNL